MKLKKLEVNSFAGIGPSSPVIIDFGSSKFVKATGDNSVGKTSLLNALLVACGHLSKDNKDFVNLESGKIDINFEFVGKDRGNYSVRVTKSKFLLTYEGEEVKEPITKMKELLGVPGVSPMEIKFKPLKDIVKWLSNYSGKSAEEFEGQMKKLKDGIKVSVTARADANRSYKGLKEYLSSEPMYEKWEASEKKYTKKTDIKDLSAKLDEAGKKSGKLIQAETKLKQLTERDASLQGQIINLQKEQAEVQKAITGGKKFVADNAGAKKEYDAIRDQYDNAAQEVAAYNKWQDIKAKKKEMDEFETLSQKADAKEKELLEKVKELQTELLPDIKGVELVLSDEMENGKVIREEGFYVGKVNSAQASETEWSKVVFSIMKKNKNKILVLDNLQSLGTDGMDIINSLIKDGCYVVAAEMHRGQQELEIEYA
jgi:hypothetical protein